MHEARPILRERTGWLRLLLHCVLLVMATRLAVYAVGLVVRAYFGLPTGWSDIWIRWDALWYLGIASDGYAHSPILTGGLMGGGNLAFFPAYPMLLRLFGLAVPIGPVMATAVSTACLVSAVVLIYRLAEERYSGGAGFWTALVLTIIPGSFVFTSAMTESLYLLVTIAASYFAHKRRFTPATLAAAVASVTRPTGVLLAPCLSLDELLQSRYRDPGPPSWRAVALFAAASLPLVLHVAYLWWAFGDGFAFMNIQTLWWHSFKNPLALLWGALTSGAWMDAGITLTGLVGFGVIVAGARSLSVGELIFAALNVLVPLFNTSQSMPRYVISVFPIYLILGHAASRHALVRSWLIPALALGNVVVMANWSVGGGFFI